MNLARGLALALACLVPAPALAFQTCVEHPYTTATGPLHALAARLEQTLAPYPSLATAFAAKAPRLCLNDTLVEEQGFFEPRTNRIVVNAGLEQDFQLAILVHEARHLEQYGRDNCPTIALKMDDYIRARLALEADAAAIAVLVAWNLRQGGDPGLWNALATWPTHDDLTGRFARKIAEGAGDVAAVSATFVQWFEDDERREIYRFAICSNYLDAIDREAAPDGKDSLPADFTLQLCVLPDGRPYHCTLPP